MIKSLALKNFKAFGEAHFEFAPLTVLAGVNGGGKSTVIQALLVANRILQAGRGLVSLNDDDGLSLGTTTDLLFRGADSQTVELLVNEGESRAWRADAGEFPDATFLQFDAGHQDLAHSRSALSELVYLSAGRFGPRMSQEVSTSVDDGVHLGYDGRYLASVLATSARNVVDKQRRLDDAPSILLANQVEAWLSSFFGPIQLDAQIVPRTDIATLLIRDGSLEAEWTLPTNTGFGITYLLPVIVAALLVPSGGVLIVDSPEAHLHPAAQSRAGRFLARMASAGVQIVVETHSDHVLNGMRLEISEGGLSSSDAVFHFVDRTDRSVIRASNSGGLSAWPPGFFDQTQVDLAALTRNRRQ